MFNIVTVTCSRDLKQTLLQVHSLNVFAKVPFHHHIFVEDYNFPEAKWRKKIEPFYEHKNKLSLYYGTLPKEYLENDGWARQQILKLEACRVVNDDYLVLDSKNFFIKPTSFEYTLKEGCYRRVDFNGIYHTLKPFVKFAARYLGKEEPKHYYVAHTPFTIIKNNAIALLDECDIRDLFEKAVDQGMRPTEFTLYSFYGLPELLNMSKKDWDKQYNVNNINYHTWWWDEDFNPAKFQEIYNSSVEILGLHKNLWKKKNEKMQKFAIWLVSRGLQKQIVIEATVKMDWGDTELLGRGQQNITTPPAV